MPPDTTGPCSGIPARFDLKVVSGYALLRHGYTASTPVSCPPTITVSGLTFKNAENEVLGTVPFRTDFAQSCNTAFVGSAGKVSAAQLADAAKDLGYGSAAGLGVQAFGGSVPTSGDEVEHAADMIGQGKVLASPLSVATASASVAAGTPVTPRLVLRPAPGSSTSGSAAASSRAGRWTRAPGNPSRPHARRGDRRDGHGAEGRSRRPRPRQDGHRRIRHQEPPGHPRLVHRLPGRRRVRGGRRGRRLRREGGRADRRRLPGRLHG